MNNPAKYSSIDVARHIINYYDTHGKIISNLRLQKMLYLCWVEYYKQWEEFLFKENFEAWKFGYIVQEVYFHYYLFAGTPLEDKYDNTIIDSGTVLILNNVLRTHFDKQPSELVELINNENSAWFCTYKDGIGDKRIIPFTKIIEKDIKKGVI